MLDIPFLLDKCQDCGSKWRAHDRNRSKSCLVCGSPNVTFARPERLAALGAALVGVFVTYAVVQSMEPTAAPAPAASATASATPGSYVAPIASGPAGSESPAKPATPANKSWSNGDASISVEGGKADISSSQVPAEGGATNAQFPSLDCSTAASDVAHKICRTPALQKADQELAAIYDVTWQLSGDAEKKNLAEEQAQWQKTRDACTTAQCLSAAYKERSEALAGLSGEEK